MNSVSNVKNKKKNIIKKIVMTTKVARREGEGKGRGKGREREGGRSDVASSRGHLQRGEQTPSEDHAT